MKTLKITDVTLRDGLQAEKKTVRTAAKVKLFAALGQTGVERLEITSFVHPKWVPQLADSKEFCQQIFQKKSELPFETMAFVPNEKGLESLLEFPIPWVSAFISTSETFNSKNINRSIAETLELLKSVTELTHSNSRKIRIYVSTLFGCPYEGKIREEKVLEMLRKIAGLSPDEVALSDTIGVATPDQIQSYIHLFKAFFPIEKTAVHLHDTYGVALANVEAAYQSGVTLVDGSTGGIGGCPYAKGATGNLSTEDLAFLSFRQGRRKMFAKEAFIETLRVLESECGLLPQSRLASIIRQGGEWYAK